MKTSKIKKIGAIVVVFIFIIILLIIVSIRTGKILYNHNIRNKFVCFLACVKENKNQILNKKIDIDWKKEYPFTEENKIEDITINIKSDQIQSKIDSLKNKIENLVPKEITENKRILESSYLYDKFILYSLVSNNDSEARVKVYDYWCTPGIFINTENISKQLIEFGQYLDDKNINLLYVQAPGKIEQNNDYISKVYIDYMNDNTDRLLDGIGDNIDYVDLRKNIKETGKDYLNLFFKTDHHWKPETGIWATGEIVKELNNRYNYNINENIFNINNYNIKVYENSYLGSEGRAITLANTSLEDISIITPKFDTDLIVKIPDEVPYNKGTFENTLMKYSNLEQKDLYIRKYYAIYGYGDKALIEIHNEKIKDDRKLLMIKDSFADVVYPFLALGVEECSIIDLRSFSGSLKTYIEEYKPDTVIILTYPWSLSVEKTWEFK